MHDGSILRVDKPIGVSRSTHRRRRRGHRDYAEGWNNLCAAFAFFATVAVKFFSSPILSMVFKDYIVLRGIIFAQRQH